MFNPEFLFSFVIAFVLPAWAMLILAPRWSVTEKLVHSMLWPLVLGAVYVLTLVLAIGFGQGTDGAGFTTIPAVRAIFASDIGVVTGWTHFLVFDLFVGSWEARDAKRRGFHHGLLIPCLFLTFMFGPVGLLLYVILRAATKKGGWSLFED
ncbi:MAG: ABA4-like family protein [Maricaulaceae bacterium]